MAETAKRPTTRKAAPKTASSKKAASNPKKATKRPVAAKPRPVSKPSLKSKVGPKLPSKPDSKPSRNVHPVVAKAPLASSGNGRLDHDVPDRLTHLSARELAEFRELLVCKRRELAGDVEADVRFRHTVPHGTSLDDLHADTRRRFLRDMAVVDRFRALDPEGQPAHTIVTVVDRAKVPTGPCDSHPPGVRCMACDPEGQP